MAQLNVVGLVAISIFYLVVFVIGLWAGWRQRRHARQEGKNPTDQEEVMLAGRNIGLFVGVLTMAATWVGGGFINGTAEITYTSGLIWAQGPFGYCIALIISGTFFAKKMRDANYVTMIDPFTDKYGAWGALQALPAAMSEVFWSASILGALGSTLEVILNVDGKISIIISAVIAVLYTLAGGFASVAYTDVFQLLFIALGLFLSLPFALSSEYVGTLDVAQTDWIGTVDRHLWGQWMDFAFLLVLGGVPWQCYFQRVLSSKSSRGAQLLSYGGAVIALIMTVPSFLFGAIGRATDWPATPYGETPRSPAEGEDRTDDTKLILPLCLQYLTPDWVTFVGLGAVSAAVMSSTDSSMLSASTMLARNVYGKVLRPKASEKEIVFVLWLLIALNCAFATVLAIEYRSTYDLFVLCGDFVFVIVFPQLCLVVYYQKSNTYGSVIAFFLSLALRLLCGDTVLGIPALMSFGEICVLDEAGVNQCGPVPFRTIIMLLSLVSHALISTVTHKIFTTGALDLKWDFMKCYSASRSGEIKPKWDSCYDNGEFQMEEKH